MKLENKKYKLNPSKKSLSLSQIMLLKFIQLNDGGFNIKTLSLELHKDYNSVYVSLNSLLRQGFIYFDKRDIYKIYDIHYSKYLRTEYYIFISPIYEQYLKNPKKEHFVKNFNYNIYNYTLEIDIEDKSKHNKIKKEHIYFKKLLKQFLTINNYKDFLNTQIKYKDCLTKDNLDKLTKNKPQPFNIQHIENKIYKN